MTLVRRRRPGALASSRSAASARAPISIAAFAPITQYVILVFMVIAGINFLRLYRFFVQRRVDVLAKDEELRLYLALIADRARS